MRSCKWSLALAPLATLAALLFTGCSGLTHAGTPTSTQVTGAALHGALHGGQQPVSGSIIQLYQVGTSGYGAGATPLIATTIKTDANGNFNVTGDYTCTTGTDVYLTATGGDAGTGPNGALALMAGLGLCESIGASTYVSLNEVTTVGAVWALAPFMNGVNIGAPTTNQAGLATAFADIGQIVNNTTGLAPGASLPTGAVEPTAEIYTLADILASCVNSAGASSSGCSTLFTNATPAGGTAPTNTLAAAVNIARNPGSNVANLFGLATGAAPFQPTLSSVMDFTVGVTYPVGSTPAALAMDAGNNVWIANNGSNSVTKLSHAGVPTTYTAGAINLPTGIAIDASGSAWITNTNNTLTELSSAGVNASGSPFSGGGLNLPSAVAIDGLGMVWVANSGAKTASVFSSAGSAISPTAGYPAGSTSGTGEVGIAVDPH